MVVVIKLGITVLATGLLLIYMQTFRFMAAVAADPTSDLDRVRNGSPKLNATLALLALLVATVLAVHKPPGLTRYGRRRRDAQRRTTPRPAPNEQQAH